MEYRMRDVLKTGLLIITAAAVFSGCKTTEVIYPDTVADKPAAGTEVSEEIITLAAMVGNSPVFDQTVTGFTLYDPDTDSLLYSYNGNKYLTPASNTKLFTYYAGLNVLGGRIPALNYVIREDSLIFWGTGDPSLLHPDFGTDDVYELLNNFRGTLYFSDSNFADELLGPGWAWGDYDQYYSAERSPLPLYGNFARFTVETVEQTHIVKENGEYLVSPGYFNRYISETGLSEQGRMRLNRELAGNSYEYAFKSDTIRHQTDKPFHYSPELITELLADTLHREVIYLNDYRLPENHETIYGMEADSLYKRMLLPSDNHAAEQIMMMISGTLGGDLNVRKGISHVIENYLQDLPDAPNWRDGSGLSRYNLFTARSIAVLLNKIRKKVNNDALLFDSLPQGGKQGTIRNLYAARDGGPAYVFAKTGTLNATTSLSGYLKAKSGKVLIFSFLNNNFVIPTREIQAQMEEILWYLHETF